MFYSNFFETFCSMFIRFLVFCLLNSWHFIILVLFQSTFIDFFTKFCTGSCYWILCSSVSHFVETSYLTFIGLNWLVATWCVIWICGISKQITKWLHMCICECLYVCGYMYVCMCICVYTYIYIYLCIYVYIYIYVIRIFFFV